jgi:hypothetical protein
MNKELQSLELEAEQLREALVEDYANYLQDLSISELEAILSQGVFTLQEVKK